MERGMRREPQAVQDGIRERISQNFLGGGGGGRGG